MKLFTTAVFLTLLVQSEAFAPSGSCSFVYKRTVASSNLQHDVAPRHTRRSTRSSELNMNLFDRFQRVAKANLNNVLKNLEDPEKILNQAVEDMQVGYETQYCFYMKFVFFRVMAHSHEIEYIYNIYSPKE